MCSRQNPYNSPFDTLLIIVGFCATVLAMTAATICVVLTIYLFTLI